ncbi:MAG: family 20 glycosylhydrolase, partial [Candidatus Hodarchaeales archaeon]
PYFHIGGDEAPKDRWKTCSDCQKRIVDNNLSNEDDLQQYFTTRLVKLLKNLNKIPIGWNEILPVQYDELDQDVIGQHWLHGDEIVVDHLRQGRKS